MIRRLLSRLRPQPLLALANGTTLALAAPAAAASNAATRTIEGLIVPYGPIGQTSAGRLRFAAGSLRISNPARVKLLREHDQREPVAVGRSFEDVTAAEADSRLVALGRDPLGLPGMWGVFGVPEGTAGDVALAEAASGLRDAFSVGVQLDDHVAERLRRANGAAVDGAGQLRETSLVSVPAFDDARVGAAAHADLVVSAWADPTPTGGQMHCTLCGQVHAAGVACPTPPATAQATTTTTTAPPAPAVPTQQPPASAGDPPVATAATTTTTTTSAAPTAQGATPAPDPAPTAVAGAALVVSEPATYTFAGDGPSLAVDAWQARMHGNAEAAQRLQRFNAELVGGNPASVMALAAVLTRDDAGATPLLPQGYRPDLLVRAINVRRPIVSRLQTVRLVNAQPFSVPIEGEFDGVADHVEGTAHAPEGTYDVSDDTVTPKSVSGAFRLSRELIDQSNPAIDQMVVRGMGKDYARKSEDKAIAALVARNDAAPILNVDTVAELTDAIDQTVDDDDVSADFAALGKTLMSAIKNDTDADGRRLLGATNPVNAAGTIRGRQSYDIDGVEVFRSSRLTPTDGFIVHAEGVLWGESSVLTFRFDEVEGPGIIKLALWAYNVARVLVPSNVKRVSSAAA